jgi:glycosyltransferase involved in cell wall biosynthesis
MTPLRLAVGRWERAARRLVGPAFAFHAHDLSMLPVAARLQRRWGGHLVYDSHELFLETRSLSALPGWLRSVWRAYERHFVARCTAVITVNDSIAGELQLRYGLRDGPTVVRNCPPIWREGEDLPRTDLLRRRLGIPAERRVALYHGGFARQRGLEQFIEAMRQPALFDATAVFLGYGELRSVLERAGEEPPLRGRLFVLDAVDPADLLAWVSSADVSVVCIQPACLSYRLSSPNKMFESLAAGTPVVASRLPEIERVIGAEGRLGRLVEPNRPDQIAAAIRALLDLPPGEATEMRHRCRRAALDTYNWEREAAKLLALYDSLR